MSGVVVALATFPDLEAATRITRQLVEEKLAACGNILPGVRSIFQWQGKLEENTEVLVFYKTSEIHRGKFQQRLIELHPYDVPECLFLDVRDGSPEYLNWVRSDVLLGNWRKS